MIPDSNVLKELEKRQQEAEQQKKRGPGRPKGAKDTKPRKKNGQRLLVDPKTGIAVNNSNMNAIAIKHMGDERVTAFVQYHIDMMQMRQGVNFNDVPDLYNRFYRYLAYCAEHAVIPNNMNAYYAIGVDHNTVSSWHLGKRDAEHKRFADDVMAFFASVHEQGAADGIFNPISSIFWQKAHDGLIEAQKLEVVNTDPLGEKQSAEQIAAKYQDVALPD